MNKNSIKNEQNENIIADLKAKYPQRLFQVTIPGDEALYIARECSWSEFSPFVQNDKPNADILPGLVKAFLVHPSIDEQDFEFNTSGSWAPGKIITIAQKIQEALGYSEAATVTALGNS